MSLFQSRFDTPVRNSLLLIRRVTMRTMCSIAIMAICMCGTATRLSAQTVLAGTEPLEESGEIDVLMIQRVDQFLLNQIAAAKTHRNQYWDRESGDAAAYQRSIEPNRSRLRHRIGVRDQRVEFSAPWLLATTDTGSIVAQCEQYEIHRIAWPVVGEMRVEGLLLTPKNNPPLANVVAIPDATQTPEAISGMVSDVPATMQYARRLAENGCQVVVPVTVSRQDGPMTWNGRPVDVSHREFLYRSSFELGRHLIGYEVQQSLACVDWFKTAWPQVPVGIAGWGDGGMIALYASAIDPRVDSVLISGYFSPRENLWDEPIDRNVFGLLEEFGDAELASMRGGQAMVVDATTGPEAEFSGGAGAPARLVTPAVEQVREEFDRGITLVGNPELTTHFALTEPESTKPGAPAVPGISRKGLASFLQSLGCDGELSTDVPLVVTRPTTDADADQRMRRQMEQIDRHNQHLLAISPGVRKEFMRDLDFSSIEAYQQSTIPYREKFYRDVIGRFDLPVMDFRPRTRLVYDEPGWLGYEVMLDVYPGVFAYGLLLVPKDLAPGQRRPVVVCQHGLEGRPQDTIGESKFASYKAFAARLAEQGYITFAPQNIYRHGDRFRTLQRKGNTIGKTLFSVITPQHQQIVDWLQTLPMVDPEKIGFYGLSYGGKTAMRVPALVTDYCFSICSADFNDWVDKNASTRNPHSYVWTGEYEIFEFDLGSTFGYAEMAALIAPRPFMVERGHFDGVADDETVAWEFAKVRRLYQGNLKIGDRCRIEWFDGPHTINGQGTFAFIREHFE
jgi:dienelactone hydrolase